MRPLVVKILIIFIFSCAIQTVQYGRLCMNSSRNLHDKMFEKILKAPSKFFDTNPSGTILNRFSKDMGSMDEMLPTTVLDVIRVIKMVISLTEKWEKSSCDVFTRVKSMQKHATGLQMSHFELRT